MSAINIWTIISVAMMSAYECNVVHRRTLEGTDVLNDDNNGYYKVMGTLKIQEYGGVKLCKERLIREALIIACPSQNFKHNSVGKRANNGPILATQLADYDQSQDNRQDMLDLTDALVHNIMSRKPERIRRNEAAPDYSLTNAYQRCCLQHCTWADLRQFCNDSTPLISADNV